MSSCDKELYDYEQTKKCYKCEIILSKSNFRKDKTKNDEFHPQCKFFKENNHADDKDRLLNQQKVYDKENRDRVIEYQKK